MVKMVLGSSDAQGQTMSSVGKARVTAYNSAVTALSNFNGAGDLQGSAYDSGKQYGVSVITPLIKGAIMYSEYLSEAVPKLPSKYRSEVGGEDLDSAVLESEIQSLESSISSLRGTFRAMESSDHADKSLLQNISSRMDSLTSQKNEKMEKLRKLNLFAGSSNEVFSGEGAKSMDTVVKNLASGLNMIQGDFASFGGTFPKHSGKTLNWAKSIEGEWDKKAKIDEDYQKVLEKANKGKELSDDDVKKINAYKSRYSNRELPENIQQKLNAYNDKKKQEIKRNKKIEETAKNAPRDVSTAVAIEKISSDTEDKIINAGAKKAAQKSAEIYANRYNITMSNGKNMGRTPGATKAAMEATENSIEGTSRAIGKSVSTGLGLVAGVGIDMLFGDSADEAWGKEITNTAATAGTLALIEGGSAALATAGIISNPIGLGFGATVAIGIGISYANEWAREAFPEVKKFEDNVGKAVVSGWNNVVNGVKGLFSW